MENQKCSTFANIEDGSFLNHHHDDGRTIQNDMRFKKSILWHEWVAIICGVIGLLLSLISISTVFIFAFNGYIVTDLTTNTTSNINVTNSQQSTDSEHKDEYYMPTRHKRSDNTADRQDYSGKVNGGNALGNHYGSSHPNHPFTHLSGIADGSCGPWLSWHTPAEDGLGLYQDISTDLMQVVANTFIRIRTPGYYRVYSQLTFHTAKSSPMGFELVRLTRCGRGHETTLLQTKTTQAKNVVYDTRKKSLDSAFVSGIFKFDALDEIAIRITQDNNVKRQDINIATRTDTMVADTLNYFGVSMLSPIDKPTISLCPEIQVHRCAL